MTTTRHPAPSSCRKEHTVFSLGNKTIEQNTEKTKNKLQGLRNLPAMRNLKKEKMSPLHKLPTDP
jgi:hypothetical protein